MTGKGTIHFLTPTFVPNGGVVKIFDYVMHARRLGYRARVFCPRPLRSALPLLGSLAPTPALLRIERFQGLLDDDGVELTTDPRIGLGLRDFAYLSLPTQYPLAGARRPEWLSPERVIHIVQNVRHANPAWLDGYGLRLLGRPMARIATNDVVLDAIRPYLNHRSLTRVIPLGHQLGYFAGAPRGELHRPIRVAYTTWKSDIGDRVARRLRGRRFAFRAIRHPVGWPRLRELYAWCDVFLAAPNPQEGFYMPAFEAMEAGAIVIIPDAGGNRAYCRFGENCVHAELDDAPSYVAAIERVARMGSDELEAMRERARAELGRFTLEREAAGFRDFMAELEERVAAFEAGAGLPE